MLEPPLISLRLGSDPALVPLCTNFSPAEWACCLYKWSGAWSPDLPSPSCVTLGKEPNTPGIHLRYVDLNRTYLIDAVDIEKTVLAKQVCALPGKRIALMITPLCCQEVSLRSQT